MGRLNGIVAIVTGAAMGQGEAEARMFAREGAKVVATDIAEDKVQKVVDEIKKNGGQALALRHDVSSEEDWKRVIQATVKTFGQLNVLVNNAGILSMNGLEATSLAEWNKIHSVNSTGVFLGMKYAVPEMRKAGKGSIINISSIYGLIGAGAATAYQTTKGAVRLLTKSAAIQYAKENIRINSVHPGVIATPMTKELLSDEPTRAMFEQATPLPRFGTPEDVAYGALFLASEESSFMTGSELVIDGGYTTQ